MATPVLAATPEAIAHAADIIRRGGLVAFPTETVYGLGANATNADAIERIFAAKRRPHTDPIIVHVADHEALRAVALDPPLALLARLSVFMPGALTLILKRAPQIPGIISAGRATVAVRMPSHPVAHALIRAAGVPIAAPSANTFSRPSATTAAHVLEDLDGAIDLILDDGAATIGVESTILDITVDPPLILRPGGVTIEALRALLPTIGVLERYLSTDINAAAPGQMLKHYSPRAKLRLYTGDSPDAIQRQMVADHAALQETGQKVGVLGTGDKFAALHDDIHLGNTLNEISQNLFAALRAWDGRGVDTILIAWTDHSGLGAAIWDRLLRAANGEIIRVIG